MGEGVMRQVTLAYFCPPKEKEKTAILRSSNEIDSSSFEFEISIDMKI